MTKCLHQILLLSTYKTSGQTKTNLDTPKSLNYTKVHPQGGLNGDKVERYLFLLFIWKLFIRYISDKEKDDVFNSTWTPGRPLSLADVFIRFCVLILDGQLCLPVGHAG